MKTPGKRSAPVYSGCSQHPKTHRSVTHVGSHMHPFQGIPGAFPVQEALSLCPGPALSGLLLAGDRLDSCAGQGDTEGAQALSALEAPLLARCREGAVGPMGCT